MQLSGALPSASVRSTGRKMAKDPIVEARDLLRAAARLPFATGRSREWRGRFLQQVASARDALRRHILQWPPGDPGPDDLDAAEPRLIPAVERQRAEHRLLDRQVEDLVSRAEAAGEVDIWGMVELGERAALLAMALGRHHNRLLGLIHERANLQLGGEAG